MKATFWPTRASVCVEFQVLVFLCEQTHTYWLQGGRVIEFLLQVLGNEESDKVQALICTGFAKFMLSGMISDERVCAFSHAIS